VGKLPVSHRYNRLPLLPSDSGGFQQELIAQDLPGAKVSKFSLLPNKNFRPCNFELYRYTNNADEQWQQIDNFNEKRNNSQKNRFIFVKPYQLKTNCYGRKNYINLEILSRFGCLSRCCINPVIGYILRYRKYIFKNGTVSNLPDNDCRDYLGANQL